MKKLLFVATAVAGLALFGAESVDVFDVKISAKNTYVNDKGVCDYRGDSYVGKLVVSYDDDGYVADTECVLKNNRTKEEKEYYVTFESASACGKKMTVANAVITFDCEDGSKFVCAGKGSTFVARKAQCNMCGGSVTQCDKVKNLSGNMVGYTVYPCPCATQLLECGAYGDDTDTTACWGSFSMNYNKKESGL